MKGKKTGGRQKGTLNRTTEQFRTMVKEFVITNWPRIQSDFDALKPGERVLFLERLIRHFLPEPLHLDRLSESQMQQLWEQIQIKYGHDESKRYD